MGEESLSNSKVDVANKWEAPVKGQHVGWGDGITTGPGLKSALGKC
ncbi:unannotated protein [freshwater metagenome]|uniref:Unannotated protein n=1 Tax=freshwater metagenome TaxID=449393 RepID=A0A6J6FVA7_9ZZZZ